jgi:conjugative transfer signal peptidase TraF
MMARIPEIKAVQRTSAALLLLLLLHLVSSHFGKRLWLNLTGSEPVGLYRMEKLDRTVKRGEMVVMGIPARFQSYVYGRHWLPAGWPLLKHVGGVAGDLYCCDGSSFSINGVPIGPVYTTDSDGLPLPRIEGCHLVPHGHFLPVATGLKTSFDGRYMGPVPLSEIKGLLQPVWTFHAE